MKKVFLAISVVLCVLCVSCSNEAGSTLVNALLLYDTKPPQLLEVFSESDKTVRLTFDEKVQPFCDSFDFFDVYAEGYSIVVNLNESLKPGIQSSISGRVKDQNGNTSQVSVNVWGYNPNPAKLLINEFTTKGTETNPDRTELLVVGSGNLCGLTLYCGSPVDYDSRIVFEDIDVKAGDFLTVFWTENLPDKVAAHPSDNVYNFYSGTQNGPSSNNGAQVLCLSPSQGSSIEDCVLYSNFSSSQYDGWGTKTAQVRAEYVIKQKCWTGRAIDSSFSTATRSMSRILGSEDENTADNWYVTVTGGATFSKPNTSGSYN